MVKVGDQVLYRTDGRNGLSYDLPAVVTVTRESHPGDYPDGSSNPLPVPDPGCVHLTVSTPGGFGCYVENRDGQAGNDDEDFVGGRNLVPGSGTYVEWNVPSNDSVVQSDYDGPSGDDGVFPRTFRHEA